MVMKRKEYQQEMLKLTNTPTYKAIKSDPITYLKIETMKQNILTIPVPEEVR